MFKKILSFFAMFEGLDHLIFSAISFWGLINHHIWNFFAWLTPVADTFFGFMSILTGLVLHRVSSKRKEVISHVDRD